MNHLPRTRGQNGGSTGPLIWWERAPLAPSFKRRLRFEVRFGSICLVLSDQLWGKSNLRP